MPHRVSSPSWIEIVYSETWLYQLIVINKHWEMKKNLKRMNCRFCRVEKMKYEIKTVTLTLVLNGIGNPELELSFSK
jgi:adenosine deaminase